MTLPVFVVGVAPRSGTNYLEDLLCVHRDCGLGVPLRESELLVYASHLKAYVEDVTKGWSRKSRWGFQAQHVDDLYRSLGSGLSDFLVSQVDDRRRLTSPPASLLGIEHAFKHAPRFLITKTPKPDHLSLFPRLFPQSPLILLMRDGRTVVESSMRSWGWPFDTAVAIWRKGAREFAGFLDQDPQCNFLLVRYEDLIEDLERELGRIFALLDLHPSGYDWLLSRERPVRGSSTVRGVETPDAVTWSPVAKPASFDPRDRHASWSPGQHARFNHMAGDLLARFGYDPNVVPMSPTNRIVQLSLDARMRARAQISPLARRLRRSARATDPTW